jgi:MFS transporter, DHA2 family, multidrug resistance protein
MSASIDEATWAAYIVPGGQRHHPADDGLTGENVWPQAAADLGCVGIHQRFVSLRPGSQPASANRVRILQGASGGCLQPLSQAVMLEAFPPQDRGKAMGFWGFGIVVAPMLGPVLGG